jgi:hypothetical protein
MKRTIVTLAVVAGVAIVASLPAAAEEGSPSGEPAAAAARTEVPEAAVALAFPADWAVDIEMRPGEDWGLSERYDDAAPLRFWNVLYASPGGRPWCDVTWYPEHPMTLAEQAIEYELLMTPTLSEVERTIEVTPTQLPAGEAFRFVIYNGPTDDFGTVYLLESEVGRYFLQCVSDERADDDWLSIASSIEWLAVPEVSPEP